ncbi:LEA14-like dessication related protein [Paucibacter oligotrophus]|uniref:LEA14-like dessication related protein n=1 Tax=Roseateles oligotrophus TaxID=1769250 RepID=A0A840L853_9BURK|nr:LEA type 2 family protein [Roseateles oligotrophus]MBB4842953.1 LEA14-like dessication related protein [Roseateles oligotrophus]
MMKLSRRSSLLALFALAGCASLGQGDALRVQVAGVETLAGEGLELRLLVKLRVQNPNERAIEFDGVALELALNGKRFASGVSDQKGVVPRFGEALVNVPLTVSAFAAVRQAFGLGEAAERGELPYELTGKLAGGLFGSVRFSDTGLLRLPGSNPGSAPSSAPAPVGHR